MSTGIKRFRKDDGNLLPMCDSYLLPFLSPTTKRTDYRSQMPDGEVTDRHQARILLQVHQLLSICQSFGLDLEGKTMLDVGTGNGLIPRLVLAYSKLKSAVGVDPFLPGEFLASFKPINEDETFTRLLKFLDKYCESEIQFGAYKDLLQYENYSLQPSPIPRVREFSKSYKFFQLGAHELEKLDTKFDFIYCKAIEHIQNWNKVFHSVEAVSKKGSIFYLKHRSFFSYLGAHRYSTISIPWGHLLLTDLEYKRYADEYCGDNAKKMTDFFFNGLTYPRQTISDMVRIAAEYHFIPVSVIVEPTRHLPTVYKFTQEVHRFWEIVLKNFPSLSADEVFSGMHHILFRKV